MTETHKSKPSMQGGSNKQSATAGNKSPQGSSRGSSTAKSQQSSARASGSGSEQKSGNDKNR